MTWQWRHCKILRKVGTYKIGYSSFTPNIFSQLTKKILLELLKVHDILIIHFRVRMLHFCCNSLFLNLSFLVIIFRHIRNICTCFKDIFIGSTNYVVLFLKFCTPGGQWYIVIHQGLLSWQQLQLPVPREDVTLKHFWLSVYHHHQTLPQSISTYYACIFLPWGSNTQSVFSNIWFLCPFQQIFSG